MCSSDLFPSHDMGDYRLKDHDVKDFKEMVSSLGFSYEKAEVLVSQMKDNLHNKTEEKPADESN